LTTENDELISRLSESRYLYLRSISEPRNNSVTIVVDEAIADELPIEHRPDSSVLFSSAATIRTTDKCLSFEIQWNRYVAYLVTEEMVGSGGSDEDETYTGKLFRVYTKSHFLDHLSRDTGYHDSAVLHFKILCLNHLIDVAAYDRPSIRILQRSKTDDVACPKPN
jgi:hypothetical protein